MTQQHITYNAHGRYTRFDELYGRDYIVAPMVMLTEGVHNGSGGPLYYEAAELERTATAWDGKPIVVYHPTVNGQGVSADDPDILAKQGVGVVKKAMWSGRKLRAEAWLDVEKLMAIAPEVFWALQSNEGMVEVSTGLYTDNEYSPGWYGGKDFEFVARNHKPDHLAILPKGAGACAVADGCGLLQVNETRKETYTMRNDSLPMPVWDFGHNEPTLNHANANADGLPLPRMGYEAPPVVNYGGGDRDDNLLPMPVMNFGPACGCAPVANADDDDDDEEGLPLPVMNFGPACGCAPVANYSGHGGGGGDVLPLPVMNFGEPGQPTPNHEGRVYGNVLPMPSTL